MSTHSLLSVRACYKIAINFTSTLPALLLSGTLCCISLCISCSYFQNNRLTDKLTERCKGQPMEESGLHFIDSLAELLRRLLDYRAVPHGDEYRDLHMHVVFNLLVRNTMSYLVC